MESSLNDLSVCAIIISYNPCLDTLEKMLCALKTQVSQILVVDNGSDIEIITWLNLRDDIVFIALGCNLGIATAHNKGISWALKHNYTYVLLMDHDSIPMSNMVQHLLNTMNYLLIQNIQVAAVGPTTKNIAIGRSFYFIRIIGLKVKKIFCNKRTVNKYIAADFLISSGSLISLQILKNIGLMEEDLFIDLVDIEWFYRAKHKGYQAFGVCDAVMHHSFGDNSVRFWFGHWHYISLHHNPLRCYYQYRNSIILYKKNYIPLRWVLSDIIRSCLKILFYLIFMPQRATYASMFIKGIWHGITNKVGVYK